ncbi:MAG: ATP-binding protein, partial [Candidatus Binatia bacterium]
NPFFMEEIVRELFERGILVRNGSVRLTRPVHEIRIPATIQGVLAARIDRLEPMEKEVVQSAAVVGRGFTLSVVEAVTGRSAEELRQVLTRLQRAELVYERPAFPESDCTFKHALTREVAYNSVLLERRKLLHERAARAIEELYADRLEERYSELAYHYSHSKNVPKAVEYLRLAGEAALRRSAHAEGVGLFQRALALVEELPAATDRDRRELELQLALGPALISSRGEAAEEVERTYGRARDLCLTIGDRRRLFPVVWGLWLFHLLRAQYGPARELAREVLALGRELGEQALLVPAHLASAMTHFFLGEVPLALEHAERAVAAHDPAKHRSQAFVYSLDPGVHSLCYVALARWCLGQPDEAVSTVAKAVSLADGLALPYVQAIARFFSALVRLLRREPEAAEAEAEKCVSISKDHGFPQWLAGGAFIRAWALTEEGRTEEGFDQFARAMAAGEDARVRQMTPWAFSLMAQWDVRAGRNAEIHQTTQREGSSTSSWVPFPRSSTGPSISLTADAAAKSGKIEEGLSKLEIAIAAAERTGERWWEPELQRLRGELVWQTDPNDQEAEACFGRAIRIARDQESRSLELRATTSLSRFLASKGKVEEARTALADVYSSFAEGFDTPDLKEARALLEALRSAAPGEEANVFRREGDFWTVAYAGKVSRLRDAKGIRCIAHLLRHPGREFHVLELSSAVEDVTPAVPGNKAQIMEAGLRESRLGAADDVLDPRARAEYRNRLAELREELAEAERFNDSGRAEKLRQEIEALTGALAAAMGPGGRARKTSSPTERARVNLTKT